MTAADLIKRELSTGKTALTLAEVKRLAQELRDERQQERRVCSEGCGRELWPHEDIWCGICGGGEDETTRPDVGSTRGVVGAFVLPSNPEIDVLLGVAPCPQEQRTV